jgi:hypothetical protein
LEGYKFLRIDGTTKISERQGTVKVPLVFFVKVYVMDLTSSLFFTCISNLQDFQEGPRTPMFFANYACWQTSTHTY